MQRWVKNTLIAIFGAALLVGVVSSCARGHYSHGPMSDERMSEMRGKIIGRISNKLDLDDVQRQKLEVLADEMSTMRTALRGTADDPGSEVSALIAGDRFDRSRAQALLDARTQVVRDNGPAMINAMADFYDSLNPEQQKQIRDRMDRIASHGMSRGKSHGTSHAPRSAD